MNFVSVLVTIVCVILQKSWQQNQRICGGSDDNLGERCYNICELLDSLSRSRRVEPGVYIIANYLHYCS